MFGWLANAWRVPELRKRVLFTAGILAAYRLGSWVPAPGVDQKALASLFSGGGILTLLNLFSGSALSRFSLFALGIMPYVTASIIVQLLTVVVPRHGQLRTAIQSARRQLGRRQPGGGPTSMPLRVSMAGVIPVIFAAAVMALPPTAAEFVPKWSGFVNRHFQPTSLVYLLIEGALII